MPRFAPVLIELSSRIVTEATIHNSAGGRLLSVEIGKREFFVAPIGADRGELGISDGVSYSDAIPEVETACTEWDIAEPLRDLVGGGGK